MGHRSIFVIITLTVIAGIFGVLFLLGGAQHKQNKKTSVNKIVPIKKNIDTINIVKDPLVYDGLTVEVESNITDWVTKRSFTLSATSGGVFGGERQLLVITKKPFSLPKGVTGNGVGLGETVKVHIKGKARIMDRVELGRELDLDLDGKDIRLDDNNIANWTEGTVLLADTVERL